MSRPPTVLARLSNGPLLTKFGEFELHVFHDGRDEAIALTRGDVRTSEPVWCRIHSECMSAHVFFSEECDCGLQMQHAQKLMQSHERGIIILLRHEGRGNGAAAYVATLGLKRSGVLQDDAYEQCGFPRDGRNFSMAAKILGHFGIRTVHLLSSNLEKRSALEAWGIQVVLKAHSAPVVAIGGFLDNVVARVRSGGASPWIAKRADRVFIVGDLNVDYIMPKATLLQQSIINRPPPSIGGTAYNAACAFQEQQYAPIVFGKTGEDTEGEAIRSALNVKGIPSFLGISKTLPTGTCFLFFGDKHERSIVQVQTSANDYDLANMKRALALAGLGKDDIAFFVAHPLARLGVEETVRLLEELRSTGCRLVVDLVPHNIDQYIDALSLAKVLAHASVLIAEYPTLARLYRLDPSSAPANDDLVAVAEQVGIRTLIVRSGVGNASRQHVVRRSGKAFLIVEGVEDTGYTTLQPDDKRGFGDRLTARTFRRLGSQLW